LGAPLTPGPPCIIQTTTNHVVVFSFPQHQEQNMNQIIPLTADTIAQAVDNDPQLKSDHTRRQYVSVLTIFDAWRNDRPVTVTLVKQYLANLQKEGLSPNTINQKLSAIKWWARTMAAWAADFGTPEQANQVAEQAARIEGIKGDRGTRPQRGRHVANDEVRDLLNACDDGTPAGLRDRAIFAVLFVTGMRQAELRALSIQDIKFDEDRMSLTIHGKGDKTRQAYVYNGAKTALQSWLNERSLRDGTIFCSFVRGGRPNHGSGLSHEGLRKIFEARIQLAGLTEHLTPHDLRRTFAGNRLDEADIATVQALLGHVSPTTTAMYDRRGEERRRQAVADIQLPE